MSQSLERAMTILRLCADKPRRLSELAGELDVHRSTALRLMQTLERDRFVRRSDGGVWAIGSGLYGLVHSAGQALELRELCRPRLLRVAAEAGHTVHLAELIGDEIVYVDKVEGRGAVHMHSRVGDPVVIQTAAVAKVIMAYADHETFSRLLGQVSFRKFTETTITSSSLLSEELGQVREQGFAVDRGELEDYLACIAVPIFDGRGEVRAGISLTSLIAMEPLEKLRRWLPLLQDAAGDVSSDLGWRSGETALT